MDEEVRIASDAESVDDPDNPPDIDPVVPFEPEEDRPVPRKEKKADADTHDTDKVPKKSK